MRQPALSRAPLSERIWRATACGFSVTALALNALAHQLPSTPTTPTTPTTPRASSAVIRSTRSEVPAFEAALPSSSSDRARETGTPDADLAVARLARRFSDARDADLSALANQLAAAGGPRAHSALFGAARSTRSPSRDAALEALASLDTADVREFMLGQLSEREPPRAAIDYFAGCHDARALPALERLAREASPVFRDSAIVSLFAQGASAEPALSRLLQGSQELENALLESPTTTAGARRLLRKACVQRLRAGAITTGSVFDFLEQDLSAEAGEALTEAARDPASASRALAALSNRGDRASSIALERLSNDSDRRLAAQARCTLDARIAARQSHTAKAFAR